MQSVQAEEKSLFRASERHVLGMVRTSDLSNRTSDALGKRPRSAKSSDLRPIRNLEEER